MVAATIAVAQRLEEAGAAAICLHGRRRQQREHDGAADWGAMRAVRRALRVPLVVNGSVASRRQVGGNFGLEWKWACAVFVGGLIGHGLCYPQQQIQK
jgi:tRNA-dihydrouridine synthase